MSVEMLKLTSSKSKSCLRRLRNYLSLLVHTVDVCKYQILVDAKSFLVFFLFLCCCCFCSSHVKAADHRIQQMLHVASQAKRNALQISNNNFSNNTTFSVSVGLFAFFVLSVRFKCQIQLYSLPMSRISAEKYICKLAIMMSKQQIYDRFFF